LARNRYITDITCPLSLSTAINNTHMQCQLHRHNRSNQGTNCMGHYLTEQSVKKLSMLINLQVHQCSWKHYIGLHPEVKGNVYKLHTPLFKHVLILSCHLSISSPCSLFCWGSHLNFRVHFLLSPMCATRHPP
jgi:hypothetical protein